MSVCLSVCLYSINVETAETKKKNRFSLNFETQIFFYKIRELFVCFCFSMFVYKEKIFTIETEDGRAEYIRIQYITRRYMTTLCDASFC